MLIRKAIAQDMPQVLALIQELAVFEKEPEAVVVTAEEMVRDGFGKYPLFHCFVAEKDKQIIGIALYYYRYSTWKGKTIHLEDLIVKQEERRTGVGFKLYSEIIRQGKLDAVKRIEWNVLDWNQNAIDFYEKTGAKVLKDWCVVQIDDVAITNFLSNIK